MLNIEATLGLRLLRNVNNWKKLVKGLIQRPLNPAESLLMSWWALRRLQQKAASGQTRSLHSIHQRSAPQPQHMHGRAGSCLEERDGMAQAVVPGDGTVPGISYMADVEGVRFSGHRMSGIF